MMIQRISKYLIFTIFKLFFIVSLFFSKHALANHKNDFLLSEANQKMNVVHSKEINQRFTQWEQLVFHNLDKTNNEKLKLVNDFYNNMKWVDDKELWNQKDYWATPIESLIRNAGDCEDFSIAKYFTLLAMDVPEEQLKITYVKLNKQQGHMVLFYYSENSTDPLVLDNMKDEVLKISQRPELSTVFSFNSNGLWLSINKTSTPNEENIIPQWTQMIKRIKKE